MAGHMALIDEAAVMGDGGEGPGAATLGDEFLGAIDAQADQIFVGRVAGGGLELAREVEGAEAGGGGQFVEGEGFVEAAAHEFHDFEHGHGWHRGWGFQRGDVAVFAEQVHGRGAGDILGDDA